MPGQQEERSLCTGKRITEAVLDMTGEFGELEALKKVVRSWQGIKVRRLVICIVFEEEVENYLMADNRDRRDDGRRYHISHDDAFNQKDVPAETVIENRLRSDMSVHTRKGVWVVQRIIVLQVQVGDVKLYLFDLLSMRSKPSTPTSKFVVSSSSEEMSSSGRGDECSAMEETVNNVGTTVEIGGLNITEVVVEKEDKKEKERIVVVYQDGVDVGKEYLKYKKKLQGEWGRYVKLKNLWFRALSLVKGRRLSTTKSHAWRSRKMIEGLVIYGLRAHLTYFYKGVMNVLQCCLAHLNGNVYEMMRVCEALNEKWRKEWTAKQFEAEDVLKFYKWKYIESQNSGYLYSDSSRLKFFDFESASRPWNDHLVWVEALGQKDHHSSSALQDELYMLQEENESMLEKLRLAEDRKEAALKQREAALKVAAQAHVKSEEVTFLRFEAETARDEATSAMKQLHEAESEVKSLRSMTQRMILTKEEMEEVVLKRCWLARYWNLCVQHDIHDIHPEIAGQKYEFWSSLAPLPLEVVLSAGQKAKEENIVDKADLDERDRFPRDMNDLSGEGNIESMLFVEKGMRELASLKVEDANILEAFELNKEESEDVLFKQAWLRYFWRRAKTHGLEPDIVDERLQLWINLSTQSPTSHDAVDVEKGLMELKKLGIENQLWLASRKWIETDSMYARIQPDSYFF
ncbi:hypothetical protein GIB67_021877 [Kingdonia uniflora]|uniref:Uncharacterized protein n=1 Tax=Kingdonia uniflora TaxID=39325 RepID=A0A7J7NEM2_9MAGN|nr:hypothetical protein GIB67_021877 [Kingdonia uniflora]